MMFFARPHCITPKGGVVNHRLGLLHGHSAIYIKHMARYVACGVRGKEKDAVCNVRRPPEPAERYPRRELLLDLVREGVGHGGLDEAGRDRVAGDVAAGELPGDGLCEAYEPRLARRIVGLARVAYLAYDRGYVDYPAPAHLGHVLQDGLGAVEGALQVDVHDSVPVGVGHTEDEAVPGYARVVDEYMDGLHLLEDLLSHLLAFLEVRHVPLEGHRPPVHGLYRFGDLLGLLEVDVYDGHV